MQTGEYLNIDDQKRYLYSVNVTIHFEKRQLRAIKMGEKVDGDCFAWGYAEIFWVCAPHIYVTQSVNILFFLNAGARFLVKIKQNSIALSLSFLLFAERSGSESSVLAGLVYIFIRRTKR